MRKRIYEVIEVAAEGDRISYVYDVFMIIVIVASLLPLCTKSTSLWTVWVNEITVSIFIIEYLLRVITADFKYPTLKKGQAYLRYPFSFMAVIDMLSILPFFFQLGHGFQLFKIFRLVKTVKLLKALKALRAIRALKIFRYSKSIDIIVKVVKHQKDALLTVGGLAVGYILIAALIVFNVEPDTFHSFFDAIYWACVSLTTVGYGDIYPVSAAGRLVTMFSSLVGIAIVALPSGIITAGYMDEVHSGDK